MGEVRAAQSFDLGIEIRKIAPLEQQVVREIYARRHILRAEGDLLGLREEIVDHPVEHQSANHPYWHQFLRNDLGRIQHVEVEAVGEIIVEHQIGRASCRERVSQYV